MLKWSLRIGLCDQSSIHKRQILDIEIAKNLLNKSTKFQFSWFDNNKELYFSLHIITVYKTLCDQEIYRIYKAINWTMQADLDIR